MQKDLKLNYPFTKDSEWVYQPEMIQVCLPFLLFPKQLKDLADAEGQSLS